jgi:hypothetical protein
MLELGNRTRLRLSLSLSDFFHPKSSVARDSSSPAIIPALVITNIKLK